MAFDPDEAALVAKARGGDEGAFEALVVRHQDKVYGLVLRMVGRAEDAEEVAQQVFVNAYRGLGNFRGDAAFGTWLHRIAVNLSKNRLRSFARTPRAFSMDGQGEPDDAPMELPDGRAGPDLLVEARELSSHVEAALETLDADEKGILLLRDVEGLSYDEIAATLELPAGTVKSRLSRARSVLKEKLRAYLSVAGGPSTEPRAPRTAPQRRNPDGGAVSKREGRDRK